MRKALLTLCALSLVLGIGMQAFAAGQPETAAGAAKARVLTYVMKKEPGSLDVNKANDSMATDVLYHLYEGLVRNYNGAITPGVAEKWEISADGLTYTFHLRKSVWPDGQPVTAGQFEYAFKRLLDPATGAAFAESAFPIVNAEAFNKGEVTDPAKVGIKALDDYTFQLTLANPTPYFLTILSTEHYYYPLRKDYVDKYGESYAADETKIISNGPFTLEKWEHESAIRMVKNPSYWNKDAIKLDRIVQLIVNDDNTIVSMYDNGEIDFIPELPNAAISNYPTAKAAGTGSIQALQFNVAGVTPETGKVISNRNFRRALSYAVDRTALATAVAGRGTVAAGRFTHPDIYGVKAPFAQEYPLAALPATAEAKKAQEYLAAALKELGTTVDKLPKLTYLCMESTRHKLFAEGFQDAWRQVLGLTNIDITILPVPQAIQASMERKYDIYLQGLGVGVDPYEMLSYWVVDGGINWTGWNDQTYTDMIAATAKMGDPAKRFAALAACEKYLMDNGPLEPLFYPGNAHVSKDYVKGVVRSAMGAASQLIYADIVK